MLCVLCPKLRNATCVCELGNVEAPSIPCVLSRAQQNMSPSPLQGNAVLHHLLTYITAFKESPGPCSCFAFLIASTRPPSFFCTCQAVLLSRPVAALCHEAPVKFPGAAQLPSLPPQCLQRALCQGCPPGRVVIQEPAMRNLFSSSVRERKEVKCGTCWLLNLKPELVLRTAHETA